MDYTTFQLLLKGKSYQNAIKEITDLSNLTEDQVKNLLSKSHAIGDVDRLIRLGIKIDINRPPYMGDNLMVYDKFNIPLENVFKMAICTSKFLTLSILKKNVFLVRTLTMKQIFDMIEDNELKYNTLMKIERHCDWEREGEIPINFLSNVPDFYGKVKNEDVFLIFSLKVSRKFFRYLAKEYMNEITQSLAIAYCVREYYPEELKYLIDLGYSIKEYNPRFSMLSVFPNRRKYFKDVVRILFETFDPEDVYNLFSNIYNPIVICYPEFIVGILTIYFCNHGLGERLLSKLERFK